jgi:lipid II:glycine glycyltransferase (peptidoglycan interpeptide bridge formation enzyme)
MLPNSHILQTEQWAQVKENYGWSSIKKIWRASESSVEAAGLILERKSRIGRIGPELKILYCPRGPLLDWNVKTTRQQILGGLEELCKKENAIFVKIDPEVIEATGIPGSKDERMFPIGDTVCQELTERKWKYSTSQIQFRNTVFIDLRKSEEEILKRMKQKTRYNIHLAEKKDVKVRIANSNELLHLYKIYAETSIRDNFVIRPQSYYLSVWKSFIEAGLAFPLIAEVEEKIVAGLFLFILGTKAWYLYGMSSQDHREKMPNYLLQWEAIKIAKNKGCTNYDLWGAPNRFDDEDSMQGVYRFKEGLGGITMRMIGAWDYTFRPNLYSIYTKIVPAVLSIMRIRGKSQTKHETLD